MFKVGDQICFDQSQPRNRYHMERYGVGPFEVTGAYDEMLIIRAWNKTRQRFSSVAFFTSRFTPLDFKGESVKDLL